MADDYSIEVAELEAIVQRDQNAFARWFARSEIALKRSLRNYAQVVDVEAVVQDTALRVWERASTITPDLRSGFLLRWAVTVARNNARNQATRAGRLEPLDVNRVTERNPSLTTIVRIDPMLRTRVADCRMQLSENLRRAIETRLADRGERSDRELATLIGMSFDAFRQNLARGRRALKECLRKFGIDVSEYLQ